MEVTNKNFKEVLSTIEKSIKESSFIAIDAEFSGLYSERNLHPFDTPEQRYHKLKESASKFLLIQFGLCTFKYDKKTERYKNSAFNFYVYPRSSVRQAPDPRFLCQASSLEFLASQGFDFNKLINFGIPYLTPADEQRMLQMLKEKHTQQELELKQENGEQSPKTPVFIPEEHQGFINDILNDVETFLSSNETQLHLPTCSAYLRKLIYQSVKAKFPTGVNLETVTNEKKDRYIVVNKVTQVDMENLLKAKQDAELDELDDAKGFSKVVELIARSGKLVVGHNMILDVMHILSQFVDELPKIYEDFKTLTRGVFSNLLDTKLLANLPPLRDFFTSTALNHLLKHLQERPFSIPDVGLDGEFGYSTAVDQQHEAGYDAFITGLCFIAMGEYLGSLRSSCGELNAEVSFLKSYLNKLYLMMSPDIPYLNLAGDDLHPNRDYVFHVTHPKEWRSSDIYQLFGNFGVVYISWISQTESIVSLKDHSRSHAVISDLVKKSENNEVYKVQTYVTYAGYTRKPAKMKHLETPQSDVALPRKRVRSTNGTCLGDKLEEVQHGYFGSFMVFLGMLGFVWFFSPYFA